MLEGMRLCLRIAEQPAMRDVIEAPHAVPASASDEDVMAFVRANAQTNYHCAGTCAMGSVVDADLRVRGVDGLRVADASVMPTLVRGNTNAATIMIAEKAADILRGRPAPAPEHVAAAAGT
jgi:choline dehydrogenase-like flavoprotein